MDIRTIGAAKTQRVPNLVNEDPVGIGFAGWALAKFDIRPINTGVTPRPLQTTDQ